MTQRQITVLWSWNCEMGESRFGANTSGKDQPHLSGFSIRRTKGGGGRSKIIRNREMELEFCRLLYSYLIGAPADRNCRWHEPRPIHRRAITECGRFFASVTNLI